MYMLPLKISSVYITPQNADAMLPIQNHIAERVSTLTLFIHPQSGTSIPTPKPLR